jgi:exosortase/archaeosortase family protein
MLATAAAFGYFLRCGLIRSLILFVLAFPLSVVFNIIRVVATGLMVAWFGPHFAQGTRHELTGAIVFFFGVVTLVAIGWLLARGRVQPPSASGPVPRDEAAGSTLPGPAKRYVFVAVLGLLLVLGTTAQVVVERHYVQTTHGVIQRKTFADFPVKIGDFVQSGKGSFETTQIDLLRPSDMLNKTYRSPNGNNLSIWSLYWEPYRGKKTTWSLGPHSPDGCYPASGWQRVKNIGPNVMSDIIPDRNLKFRVFSKDNKKIVLVYFLSNEPIGDIVTAKSLVDRLRQMVDSWDSKDLVLGAQYVVTVQATVTSSVNQTVQDVLLFLKQIAPVLPAFGV